MKPIQNPQVWFVLEVPDGRKQQTLWKKVELEINVYNKENYLS